jgi:hypothetical protein
MRGLRDPVSMLWETYLRDPTSLLSIIIIARTLILKYLCQIINELRKRGTSRVQCFARKIELDA